MSNVHTALIIAVASLVTIAIRFAPFVVFGDKRQTPEFVTYLGKVLPYAIMGMLVVFCLKGVSLLEVPHGLPEFIASAVVVLLHIWKRNTLCSIVGGTACYMILIHFVF